MEVLVVPEELEKNELLRLLWEDLVRPGIKAFESAKAVVESLKPPTMEEITDLIDSSEEQSIIEMREALEEAETTVQTLSTQLDTWARETLSVSVSADEKATATQAVNREKSKLKDNLGSMLIQAEKFELTEAIEFIKNIQSLVSPAPVSSSSKSNKVAMRKWLKENGYEVSGRGRIPAELEDIYLNAVQG